MTVVAVASPAPVLPPNMNYLLRLHIVIAVLSIGLLHPAFSQTKSTRSSITIEDLANYTHILNAHLSPDGKWVSFLTLKPLLQENKFDCEIWLQKADPGSSPQELAHFQTTTQQTYFDTGELKNFGGQSAWSPDSRQLAYTSRAQDKVQIRLREVEGDDVVVGADSLEAELTRWSEDGTAILFKTTEEELLPPGPVDPSVLVTDDQFFWIVSWAKGPSPKQKIRTFQYKVASHELIEVPNTNEEKKTEVLPETYKDAKWPDKPNEKKYVIQPALSPDKKYAVFSGLGMYEQDDHRKAYRDSFLGIKRMGDDSPPKELLHSPFFSDFAHWKGDSKEVYAFLFDAEYTAIVAVAPEGGEVREIARTSNRLLDPSWDKDGSSFVSVRQNTFTPDELVKFDLKTKQFDVLTNLNANFVNKDRPEVRFMRVNNSLGGGIFGRLVLPNGYVKGKRYPLIFTTYRAGTGFLEGAIGDEFPILPFAANGFVVFAMDTGISNMSSETGDLEFSLLRYERPLEAMQLLIKQLADEGIIDPERCGITGLSYGADITAYAVATTNIFKAASLAAADLDPIAHTTSSIKFEKHYEGYGFPYADDAGRDVWKKASIALNGVHVKTALLMQSPDAEAMISLETFKALKHYGVPVEWYVYLNEGHVKYQPRSKFLAYQRNLDWMNFWLQSKEDPDPVKADQYTRWREMLKIKRDEK